MIILVLSCDKNTETFEAFHHCMEKYWQKHPTIIYYTESVQNPFYRTISVAHELWQWTKGVKEVLKKIKDEQVLIMVDDCELIRRTGVAYRDIKELNTDIILFSVGDTKCRCEITPEGKLKPIAKQKNDKELYLSTGSQWVKADLPEDAKVHIREKAISIDRWANDGGCCDYIYLSSTDALEFARSIAKTSQKEKIKEQPQETYYNAKERLVKHIAETKAMTADIYYSFISITTI